MQGQECASHSVIPTHATLAFIFATVEVMSGMEVTASLVHDVPRSHRGGCQHQLMTRNHSRRRNLDGNNGQPKFVEFEKPLFIVELRGARSKNIESLPRARLLSERQLACSRAPKNLVFEESLKHRFGIYARVLKASLQTPGKVDEKEVFSRRARKHWSHGEALEVSGIGRRPKRFNASRCSCLMIKAHLGFWGKYVRKARRDAFPLLPSGWDLSRIELSPSYAVQSMDDGGNGMRNSPSNLCPAIFLNTFSK